MGLHDWVAPAAWAITYGIIFLAVRMQLPAALTLTFTPSCVSLICRTWNMVHHSNTVTGSVEQCIICM